MDPFPEEYLGAPGEEPAVFNLGGDDLDDPFAGDYMHGERSRNSIDSGGPGWGLNMQETSSPPRRGSIDSHGVDMSLGGAASGSPHDPAAGWDTRRQSSDPPEAPHPHHSAIPEYSDPQDFHEQRPELHMSPGGVLEGLQVHSPSPANIPDMHHLHAPHIAQGSEPAQQERANTHHPSGGSSSNAHGHPPPADNYGLQEAAQNQVPPRGSCSLQGMLGGRMPPRGGGARAQTFPPPGDHAREEMPTYAQQAAAAATSPAGMAARFFTVDKTIASQMLPLPELSEQDKPLLEGWLRKKSSGPWGWRKRWFSLSPAALMYRAGPVNTGIEKTVRFDGGSLRVTSGPSRDNTEFLVHCHERTLILKAVSQWERSQWFIAFSKLQLQIEPPAGHGSFGSGQGGSSKRKVEAWDSDFWMQERAMKMTSPPASRDNTEHGSSLDGSFHRQSSETGSFHGWGRTTESVHSASSGKNSVISYSRESSQHGAGSQAGNEGKRMNNMASLESQMRELAGDREGQCEEEGSVGEEEERFGTARSPDDAPQFAASASGRLEHLAWNQALSGSPGSSLAGSTDTGGGRYSDMVAAAGGWSQEGQQQRYLHQLQHQQYQLQQNLLQQLQHQEPEFVQQPGEEDEANTGEGIQLTLPTVSQQRLEAGLPAEQCAVLVSQLKRFGPANRFSGTDREVIKAGRQAVELSLRFIADRLAPPLRAEGVGKGSNATPLSVSEVLVMAWQGLCDRKATGTLKVEKFTSAFLTSSVLRSVIVKHHMASTEWPMVVKDSTPEELHLTGRVSAELVYSFAPLIEYAPEAEMLQPTLLPVLMLIELLERNSWPQPRDSGGPTSAGFQAQLQMQQQQAQQAQPAPEWAREI